MLLRDIAPRNPFLATVLRSFTNSLQTPHASLIRFRIESYPGERSGHKPETIPMEAGRCAGSLQELQSH
jgi:hypothetical protein